jgi:DNA primase
MITQETIERIISAARVEEVVSDFVSLKKRGVNYIGRCPFHNEKTPSFTVSPVKGIYKCFGCGKAGNSVNFVMEHEQLSYPEALRWLAGKYHIEIEETGRQEETVDKTERESLYILLEAASQYYIRQLNQTEEGKTIAQPYLKERQLSQKIIESFALGWAHTGWDNFSAWALKNGYQKDFLLRTGISFETQDGKVGDRFRERIMYPIHNLSGKVVGFGGRILKSNAKEAKYINSPETEIYNKSRILYGLFQAKKAIRQADLCIVVEGYMDVLALHQAGIENVVASSGTSLTEDQLRLARRFSENLIFLFDGDAAGQKASVRGLDLALQQGLNPRVVTLPVEHDPDSFAKEHDKEEIEAYLREHALDFVAFRTGLMTDDERRDPIKKAAVLKELLDMVLLLPDRLRQAFFVKEIERRMEMQEDFLYQELRRMEIAKHKQDNKGQNVNITPPPVPKQRTQTDLVGTEPQERHVIKTLLLYGDKPYNEEQTVAQYVCQELVGIGFEWNDVMSAGVFELIIKVVEWEDDTPLILAYYEPPDTEPQEVIILEDDDVFVSENDYLWVQEIKSDVPGGPAPAVDYVWPSEEPAYIEFTEEINIEEAFREEIIEPELEPLEKKAPTVASIIHTEDAALQQFVSDLLADKNDDIANWRKFLGRDVVTPEQNYIEEVNSSLNHLKLRKVMHMIRENAQAMRDIDLSNEEEVNNLLEVHKYLVDLRMKIAGEIGAAIV